MEHISLEELCSELSISTATGKNWIRLGRLTPVYDESGAPMFSVPYARMVKDGLISGENPSLRKRRNKRYVTGNSLYSSYIHRRSGNYRTVCLLLEALGTSAAASTCETAQYLAADCFLHLFADKFSLPENGMSQLLLRYLQGRYSPLINRYTGLIDALIGNREAALRLCDEHPEFFVFSYVYEPREDVLGLIYISCRNMRNRKNTGAYYTPSDLVIHLIKSVIMQSGTILDPCCGTGNFLLQLPDNIAFDMVYGCDTDAVSVQLARLSLSLKYENTPAEDICRHIVSADFLNMRGTGTDTSEAAHMPERFDYIIGNPPWGYVYDSSEKAALRKEFYTAQGKSVESYDVFIECALRHLRVGGELAFVLPEAVMGVHAHRAVRELILKSCSIKKLCYIGDIFDGVQCPAIILDINYTGRPLKTRGMIVETIDFGRRTELANRDDESSDTKPTADKVPAEQTREPAVTRSFTVQTERKISSAQFGFKADDEEYLLLEKLHSLSGVRYLKGNAEFALGIVTGNNAEFLSDEKNDNNEMILRGGDICKYHICPGSKYIEFTPERFQQTAPTEIYRATEKLLYRFISRRLVFAYDDRQTLSLNSCNIVIPRLDGMSVKYVLAILNSRIAQFVYSKQFDSVKVLRSHIESLPIPPADEATQEKIVSLTDKLTDIAAGGTSDEFIRTCGQLDDMICSLFGLTANERRLIYRFNP